MSITKHWPGRTTNKAPSQRKVVLSKLVCQRILFWTHNASCSLFRLCSVTGPLKAKSVWKSTCMHRACYFACMHVDYRLERMHELTQYYNAKYPSTPCYNLHFYITLLSARPNSLKGLMDQIRSFQKKNSSWPMTSKVNFINFITMPHQSHQQFKDRETILFQPHKKYVQLTTKEISINQLNDKAQKSCIFSLLSQCIEYIWVSSMKLMQWLLFGFWHCLNCAIIWTINVHQKKKKQQQMAKKF